MARPLSRVLALPIPNSTQVLSPSLLLSLPFSLLVWFDLRALFPLRAVHMCSLSLLQISRLLCACMHEVWRVEQGTSRSHRAQRAFGSCALNVRRSVSLCFPLRADCTAGLPVVLIIVNFQDEEEMRMDEPMLDEDHEADHGAVGNNTHAARWARPELKAFSSKEKAITFQVSFRRLPIFLRPARSLLYSHCFPINSATKRYCCCVPANMDTAPKSRSLRLRSCLHMEVARCLQPSHGTRLLHNGSGSFCKETLCHPLRPCTRTLSSLISGWTST